MKSFIQQKADVCLFVTLILFSFALVFLWGGNIAYGASESAGSISNGVVVDFVYRCINFAVFIAILVVAAKKTAVKDFFSARREGLQHEFDELKRQKMEFESRCKDLEEKLKAFEVQRKEVLERFKQEGESEKQQIIEKARLRAEQIIQQADLIVAREINAVKQRLKEEIVDLASVKAQEIISRSIKDSDQDILFNEFIKEVENLH